MFFVCTKYCSSVDIRSKECSSCRFNFFNFLSREILYKDVHNKHVESAVKIALGEVVGVNPVATKPLKLYLKTYLIKHVLESAENG